MDATKPEHRAILALFTNYNRTHNSMHVRINMHVAHYPTLDLMGIVNGDATSKVIVIERLHHYLPK